MGKYTSYNRFVKAQGIVRDLYSRARSFRWTHAKLLAERDRVLHSTPMWNGPKHKRLTLSQREYLRGMGDTLRDFMFHQWTIWAFDVGLSMPVRYADCTPEQKDLIHADKTVGRGHHYWADSEGKLTNCPLS